MKNWEMLLTVAGISFSAIAESTQEKVDNAYLRQQSTAQVACEHIGVSYQKNKFVVNEYIKTDFQVGDLDFSIIVRKDGRKYKAFLKSKDNALNLVGGIGKSNKPIEFNFSGLSEITNDLVDKYKLKDMRCNVEVYKDKVVELQTNKVHINMHPHTNYDAFGVTTKTTENYLKRSDIEHIVFIDNKDLSRGIKLKNFMKYSGMRYKLGEFSAPTVSIPISTPIYSASAGHNLFKMNTDDLEVFYTGGNLNYCILNNLRRLMDSFLQYSSGGDLVVKMDLDGIVAQKGSWLKNAGFSGRNRSGYFVRDEFRKDPENAKKFHKTYREFFEKDQLSFWTKKKFYKTLMYRYVAMGKAYTKTLKGTGTNHYSVTVKFINE